MKNILLLFILVFLSCNDKTEDLKRQKESIAIIQTLIDNQEMALTKDIYNNEELPICLNLKKIKIDTKCFAKTKVTNKVEIIKFNERSFISIGNVCIEKIYRSNPINDSFFLKSDSLNIAQQNETFKTYTIPKYITKTFKTVELSKKLKIIEKYVQFSIPIFSNNYNKAYIEFDKHTNNQNSYGNSIYLEKINGKWKIKYIENNWAI